MTIQISISIILQRMTLNMTIQISISIILQSMTSSSCLFINHFSVYSGISGHVSTMIPTLIIPPHNLRHSHLPLLNFHQVILHLYTTNLQGVILLIQITEVAAIHPTIVGVHLLTIVVGLLLTIVGDLLLTIAGVLQITEDLHLQIIIDLIRHPLIIEVIMDLGDLQMTDIEAEVIMGLLLIMVIVDHLQGVLHPMMVTEDHLLTGIHHIIDLQDQGEATMVADI